MAVPTITSVTPATGSDHGGTAVTLVGTGFTGTTGVTVGGVAATSFAIVSDTGLTLVTPASPREADTTVDIIVTNATGPSVAASTDHFTYAATAGTYTQLDGTETATYFQDISIDPATLKSGELKKRFDTVLYPKKGAYGAPKVGG